MTAAFNAWHDGALPVTDGRIHNVKWRPVGRRSRTPKYPLWFNIVSAIALGLVPLGLIVALLDYVAYGAAAMMVGFLLIGLSGSAAASISSRHGTRHGRTWRSC